MKQEVPVMWWLIWSVDRCKWWGPARQGYTQNRALAGRYSFDEAVTILMTSHGHLDDARELMCPDWEKTDFRTSQRRALGLQ